MVVIVNLFSDKAIGRITSIIDVVENDENDFKEKLAAYGVASFCIYAGNSIFMSYSGGILDNEGCVDHLYVDHAVAAVGYGTDNEIDYWIVSNS